VQGRRRVTARTPNQTLDRSRRSGRIQMATLTAAARSAWSLGGMGRSMTKLLIGCGLQLLLVLAWLCSPSECGAQKSVPGRAAKGSRDYADVLRFISIPTKALPDHVRLVEQIRTSPMVPVTRNPQVLVDPRRIRPVAAFFGMREKSDLELVRAGVVAIYQENDPANEIGVYGLYFFDNKAARRWFNKLTKNKENPPFFLKGALLVYVWKDPTVSTSSFDAIRDYLKAAQFKPVDQERNES
jgi:hypothetical protein